MNKTQYKTQYKPQGNRVLIEKLKAEEEKTKGGVFIPFEISQHKNELETVGIIKKLGNGVDKTLGLKVGFKVKYAKHSEVKCDEDVMLVKDTDIQAIIYEEVSEEDELIETTSFNSTEQELVKHSELVGEK